VPISGALFASVMVRAAGYGVGIYLGVPAIAAAVIGGAVGTAAASELQAIAHDFIATLVYEGWARACERLAGGRDAAGDPLRAALARAFQAAAAEIRQDWLATSEARKLKDREKELFAGAESVLAGLAESESPIRPVESLDSTTRNVELRYAFDAGDPSGRAAFEKRLRAYAGLRPEEDPTNVVGFIVETLPPAFSRRFAKDLQRDVAAWQALQVILERESRAALADLTQRKQADSVQLATIRARLDRWTERLDEAVANPSIRQISSPEQAAIDSVLQTAIEAATTALSAAIERTRTDLLRSDEQTRAQVGVGLASVEAGLAGVLEVLQRIEALHPGALTWVRPVALPLEAGGLFFGRGDDLDAVTKLLMPGAVVAVQGMPGVGKTTLARHVAANPPARFTGGVLDATLGNAFRDPLLAGPILIRWVRHAFGTADPPPGIQADSATVRALLANHGPLLIVLDDVWDKEAIRPLLEARPPDATVLVTTRSDALASDLAVERVYPLGVLPIAAAVDLLRARARRATPRQEPILEDLAVSLGRHALALDLAGRHLGRIPPNQWQRYAEETDRAVVEGTVFANLPVPEEQRDRSVEAVLARSYDDLDEAARARFRQLGAFAPEASFRVEGTAGVWECSTEDAWEQLTAFTDQGLLQHVVVPDEPDEPRWQQHGLLRAYALALLRERNEADAARMRHAAVHLVLMREADDKQVYYRLLPDHRQLVHAFAWAIEHDVPLAADLAAKAANLQAAFGLVRFNYEWATRLLRSAELTGDQWLYARALGNLGNSLHRLATLPDEDRGARLREALAAYDAALTIYTPQVAPLAHAATQNNKGNVLQDLATLPDEDRAARLREALAAYDAALTIYTPQVAPLDHAGTQNNRGNVLQDLATLPDEDRAARLREALAAYDIALQYRTPQVAPLDHAATQNNRGTVLRDLATLPDEDRGARLREALRAGLTAFRIIGEREHERYRRIAMNNLRATRRAAGKDFPRFWAELGVGAPPDWLIDHQTDWRALISRLLRR
jgi:hypothetical protein